MDFTRQLDIPDRSFFLFGPRGVGKSHFLRKAAFADAAFDLLRHALAIEFMRDPSLLEARLGDLPRNAWVWIDEVQRVPAILDEVHRLIETRHWRFALSGSSARKLRRQGGNLLAGRAISRRMESLTSHEMGARYNVGNAVAWGTLPLVAQDYAAAADVLAAYVDTYLREEIREEGLIRKVEPFLRFIEVAGLMNGQQVNASAISRQAQLPRASVDVYFSILEDTLVGHRLAAFQPKLKVQEQNHPKFYWFDPGVARAAAGLLTQPVDSLWIGPALETLIYHELRVYGQISRKEPCLSYYRTKSGMEVDFIIELEKATLSRKAKVICLEVKSSKRWDRSWGAAMREMAASSAVHVVGMYGIYMGDAAYRFDALSALPVTEFLSRLHSGGIY